MIKSKHYKIRHTKRMVHKIEHHYIVGEKSSFEVKTKSTVCPATTNKSQYKKIQKHFKFGFFGV